MTTATELADYEQMYVVTWVNQKTGRQESVRFTLAEEARAKAVAAKENGKYRLAWIGGTPRMERV